MRCDLFRHSVRQKHGRPPTACPRPRRPRHRHRACDCRMGQGDPLYVGRLQIIKAVIDAGAAIKVLDRSYIDLATPIGRGFMAMMSAMAEDERLRILKAP